MWSPLTLQGEVARYQPVGVKISPGLLLGHLKYHFGLDVGVPHFSIVRVEFYVPHLAFAKHPLGV